MSVSDGGPPGAAPGGPEPQPEAPSPWADPTSSWTVPDVAAGAPARVDGAPVSHAGAAAGPTQAAGSWPAAPAGLPPAAGSWSGQPAAGPHAAWPAAPAGLRQAPPGPYGSWLPPPRRGLAALAAPAAPRTHRWGLPAFLLAEAVFLLVSAAAGVLLIGGSLGSDGPPVDVWVFVVATAVPTLAAAAVAVAVTWLRGNGPRIDLGLTWSGRDVAIGLGLGFAGLFVSTAAAAVWVAIVGPDVSSAVGDALDGLRAPWPVALAVLVAVVLVAPFCEEILYRGLLWGAVEKLGAGPWLAFVITTVVFAFAHFELVRAPLLLVIAIPIGLARLITGRLGASIVAHSVNNLLPGIALYLMLVGVPLPAPA
ncbi:lysostaphin resistance A-like protein [Pseudonocardia sp.]|uniref:CPBP family intramembrane glutamic endopeptidase n=1 Tax=Pseudonocardia sp. TaxID=60912 RepID=UPI003D146FD1